MRRGALAGVVAVMLLTSACSPDAGPSFVAVSGAMPEIAGTTLDGRAFGPSDYAGKIVVVNFWNQDCPPCREEQPVLQANQDALGSRGVVVIGLLYVGSNWPDDPSAARTFLAANGVTYANLLDRDSKLASAFGIAGIPTTIVVDDRGQLRARVLGRIRPGQLEALFGELGMEMAPG